MDETTNGNGKTTEQILDKVKKLLNMTIENGCTETEASIAMEKAQDLLFKHDLEMADAINFTPEQQDANRIIGKEWNDDTRVKFGQKYGQPVEWMIELGFTVGRWSFCKALASSYAVTFIGRKVDVEITKEMFSWIREQCERIANEETEKFKKLRVPYMKLTYEEMREYSRVHPYHGLHADPRRWRNNFLHGMVERLNSRLGKHWRELQQKDEKSTALVVLTEKAVGEYFETNWPNVKEHKGPDTSYEGYGYDEGYKAADKVALTRPKGIGTRQQLEG
jgi:hypothetical protein